MPKWSFLDASILVRVDAMVVNPLSIPGRDEEGKSRKMASGACNMASERVEHLTNLSPREVTSARKQRVFLPAAEHGCNAASTSRESSGGGAIEATDLRYPFCLRVSEKGRQHGLLGIYSKLAFHAHDGRPFARVDRRAALPSQSEARRLNSVQFSVFSFQHSVKKSTLY
jgi:hypothetical protein